MLNIIYLKYTKCKKIKNIYNKKFVFRKLFFYILIISNCFEIFRQKILKKIYREQKNTQTYNINNDFI